MKQILLLKETRAGEKRVALIPDDVKTIIEAGHRVFVEQQAGESIGFSDDDYETVGASIRYFKQSGLECYRSLFKDIDIIVRVKRPSHEREILENQTIAPGTIMIGALDPLERGSAHIDAYHRASIVAYSIDQLDLPPDDPMNLLSAMSRITGRLALQDAIKKHISPAEKIVIIGFGAAGRSAFEEALQQRLTTTVVLTRVEDVATVEACGATAILMDKNDSLEKQQHIIKAVVIDADIVITTARQPNQRAPLLIPKDTLNSMQRGAVIIDLTLSEGGNVAGSKHDADLVTTSGVTISNVSGYPKMVPREASILWSVATLSFLLLLLKNGKVPLSPI